MRRAMRWWVLTWLTSEGCRSAFVRACTMPGAIAIALAAEIVPVTTVAVTPGDDRLDLVDVEDMWRALTTDEIVRIGGELQHVAGRMQPRAQA